MPAVRVAAAGRAALGRTHGGVRRSALSGQHTGFEICFEIVGVLILPMVLPADGVTSSLAAVSSAMGLAAYS